MDRILEERGSRSLISHLSIVEMEAVLSIKMRTGEIDEPAMEIARRRFRADLAQYRLLVAPPVLERHFHSARKLLVQYGVPEGLRTLDTLQLASALVLRPNGFCAKSDKWTCSSRQINGSVELRPWLVARP